MGIFSRKNQYLGINAHYNSYLQHEPGGWPTLHNRHVGDIADMLDDVLPPNYYAVSEKSLQIGSSNESDFGIRPDISIYRKRNGEAEQPNVQLAASPTYVIPAAAALPTEPDLDIYAVVVYHVNEGGQGRPVTRIEFFSPSNKDPHGDYFNYLVRRYRVLESGINLVELDYIHEMRSPFLMLATVRQRYKLPDYYDHEEGSYPYYIATTSVVSAEAEMSPSTRFYFFRVDDPVPIIDLPLLGQDRQPVDFGAVYHRTFESGRLPSMVSDYSQLPRGFESYTPFDRARIERRMQAVQRAAAAGIDLEQGPFALDENST